MSPDDLRKYVNIAVQMLDFFSVFSKNENVKSVIEAIKKVLNEQWFLELVALLINTLGKSEEVKKVLASLKK